MKTLSALAIVAILASSCSAFDKYKTPETPNAGVDEGEKSSYLLNKPEDKTAPAPTTSAKKKKKQSTSTTKKTR